MAKFINIPTSVTGQPNLFFNGDNVVAVVPPDLSSVSLAAGAGSTTTITVTSTTGLLPGMTVIVASGTGAFAANTTVVSVTNATTFVVSAAPTTTLSAAVITAQQTYCTVYTHNRIFRLTFDGASLAVQNANAVAGSAQINNAILGTYSGPGQFNVVFTSGTVSLITVV
jgi:hypothetical protein